MADNRDFPRGEQLLDERVNASPVIAEPATADPAYADTVGYADTVVSEQVVVPVVADPVVFAPPVVDPGAPAVFESLVTVDPVTSTMIRRSSTRTFAPDAIVATLVGLFVLLVGLLAVTRAGFDGPLNTPVVSVLGFTHTTTLGLIEIVLGAGLLLSGATRSRSAAIFFGSVLGIAAFVGAVQTASFKNNLALESGFAWLMVLGGLTVVLAALLLPRYMQRSTVVHPV